MSLPTVSFTMTYKTGEANSLQRRPKSVNGVILGQRASNPKKAYNVRFWNAGTALDSSLDMDNLGEVNPLTERAFQFPLQKDLPHLPDRRH